MGPLVPVADTVVDFLLIINYSSENCLVAAAIAGAQQHAAAAGHDTLL